MSTRRVQFLVVLLAVLLEVQAGIQQWFAQNVVMTEHQRDEEARELAESAYTLRADVIAELLTLCTSVKTVRLCLQLGSEFSLP